ncbi:MAG: IPT/TIG domain-containing protein [Myxococcaceae bacterium]|nr:IPT/TIG domain-containing protein [Myxococcaceae bacterium]
MTRFALLCALTLVVACKPPPYEYPDAAVPGTPLTLDSVAPNEGRANEDTELTLLGNGFQDGLVVLVGSRVVTSVAIRNQAVVTGILQKGSRPGTYDVTVVSAKGERVSLSQAFTVVPAATGGGTAGGGTAGGGTAGGGTAAGTAAGGTAGGGAAGAAGGGAAGGGAAGGGAAGGGTSGGGTSGGGATGGGTAGGTSGGGLAGGMAGGAPATVTFALGVVNNMFAPPQTAQRLNLLFRPGTASPMTVVSQRTAVPPSIDGLDGDWSAAPASTVALSSPGSVIGMSELQWNAELAPFGRTWPFDFFITSATVKSMWDDQNLYFLVQWADPTPNTLKGTLTYDGDAGLWRRNLEDEDRLTLSFNINNSFPGFEVIGCAAACHVNRNLGDTSDAGRAFRLSMHTNGPTEFADVWEWNSATTNPMFAADDSYWDVTRRNADGPVSWTTSNVRNLSDGGVEPVSMGAGGVNSNPAAIFSPDSGLTPAAVLFDGTGVSDGTTVPGVVHRQASPARSDLRARGRWSAGVWTVELSRARLTTDSNDAQFPNQ